MSDALLVKTFNTRITSVMDTLLRAAVFEISRIFEGSLSDHQLEIARSRSEVDALKRRLEASEKHVRDLNEAVLPRRSTPRSLDPSCSLQVSDMDRVTAVPGAACGYKGGKPVLLDDSLGQIENCMQESSKQSHGIKHEATEMEQVRIPQAEAEVHPVVIKEEVHSNASLLGDDIRRAVLVVLPGLPAEKLASLLSKLASVGVESKSDLQFIKEEDLPDHLTPIQSRRLVNALRAEDQTCVELTHLEPASVPFDATSEHCSSSSSTSSYTAFTSPRDTIVIRQWLDTFEVPWSRMPAGIREAIAQERRPCAKDRREMVRLIVNEMRLSELNPSRSDCAAVAKAIVNRYPKSFADMLKDGTRIGSGYGSLLTQLKTRVEHVNRGCPLSRHRKQRWVPGSSAEPARGPADHYGCVRWQPNCPPDESEDSLRDKLKELKDMCGTEGLTEAEKGHLSLLMKTTYCLQRKAINACPAPSIADLKKDWPLLFTPKELCNHFKMLTDISILDKMEQAMREKGRLILRFFRQRPAGSSGDEMERLLRRFDESGSPSFGMCSLLLLMAFFREKREALVLQANVFSTVADVEREASLPASPRLIVFGDMLTATNWMLSIEGKVVVPPHPNLVSGMAVLFSLYYNFNLLYQEEASCTLEFIQRCFVGINPTSGSKAVAKRGNACEKRSSGVNSRVCTLLKRLMDFEWLGV